MITQFELSKISEIASYRKKRNKITENNKIIKKTLLMIKSIAFSQIIIRILYGKTIYTS